MRRIANHVCGNAGDPLAILERVGLDARLVLLEPFSTTLNECLVLQTGMDDLARHGVGQRDVASDVKAEPYVGPLRGRRAPRVDDIELRPVVDTLQEMVKPDRMRLTGVRSPEEDKIAMFGFLIRARAAARAKYCRQTDDARSVSRSVAAVDVIVAERDAGQLLRQKVHLVGGLGAAEDSRGVRPVIRQVATEPFRRPIQRFVPGSGPEHAMLTHQRMCESGIGAGGRSRPF